MNALTCIYMYCNIERNIMKNQFGSPGFGIWGEYLCIFVFCFMFSPLFIFAFRICMQVISIQG